MLNKKRLLSAVVSAMLVFSTITAPVGKLCTVNAKSSDEPSKYNIENKIEKTLKNQFKTADSKVTFLIKLKDQVDTVKTAKNAVSQAKSKGLSTYKTNLLKKSSIVSELKIKSDETQNNIKTYLEKEIKMGNVARYESFYIVNGLSVTGTEAVMEELAAMPEVQSICANAVIQLDKTKVSESEAENNTTASSNIEPNLTQIGADKVWALGINGTGITIGSLDSGVQWDHPALMTKYRGYNPSNPSQPNNECNWFDAVNGRTTPYDDGGHGTHTVGTMVGSCTGGANQIGVAPGAKWIAAKAFSPMGGTSEDLLEAGQWLLAPVDSKGHTHPELAPDIINNSWGDTTAGVDDFFRQMVINWKATDIFPEFSAGNTDPDNPGGPGSVVVPGAYPESFTTGAVDSYNNLAYFSLRGPSPYDGVLKPDISAPGVCIRSSLPGNIYGIMSGTSMAGPAVSAVVALLKQADSSLSIDEIENIIKNTATPRTDSEYPESPNNGYGYGVVNAYMAVTSLLALKGIDLGQIKGCVLKQGEDTVPPSFNENPRTVAYTGMDLPLNITVHDDISLKTVELQYVHNEGDQWTTVAPTQLNGDYKGGDFNAVIPAAEITGTSLQYRWRMVDYGNNEAFTDTHTVTVSDGISVGYSTDFETEPEGWTTGGTCEYAKKPCSWQWGVPTGGIKRAASGEKVYATNLGGSYASLTDTYLQMPPINLPQGQSFLSFKHWYDVENSRDFCYVKISTDKTNWTTLSTYTGNLGSDYAAVQLDLSAYAGQKVYIRFNMKTNFTIQKEGWFIDDVAMTDQTPASCKVSSTKNLSNSVKNSLNDEVSGLPLSGTVTVLENGASANTSPADGSYSIMQLAGDYTLKAEAYGFYSKTQAVHVEPDGVSDNVSFILDPVPKGILSGKITDSHTGAPIANAKLYLVEDAAIAPVYTDADGNYSINAYEGEYTLQIVEPDYESERVPVTITGNGSVTKDIQLKPFIRKDAVISYDDDSAEDATAFNDADNGFAMEMTLEDGRDSAVLTEGLFKFWNETFPNPGGTRFQVAVYDASGKDGTPGKMIAGPIEATAIRDKTVWTTVDLRAYHIVVPHDFYLMWIQPNANQDGPGLCIDKDSKPVYRSWRYYSGQWQLFKDIGNMMIRAGVSYEAPVPVFSTPQNNLYTTKNTVTVKGVASPDFDVHILNNDKDAAVIRPDYYGNFSADINLSQGKNILKGCSISDSGRTDYSDDINVIFDNTAPELNIISPADGLKTNKDSVTVQGTVADENLDNIEVNGVKADVNGDGTWSTHMLLNEGINTIETVATDKAGNKTTKTAKVDAKYSIKDITNLKPDKDIKLTTGKSVTVEFDSEPGLKEAVFSIHAPSVNTGLAGIKNITEGSSQGEIPMTEVPDEKGNGTGHYTGTWTATSEVTVGGAQIEVKLTDWYGNTLTKYADGKLYINYGGKISVNRIAGTDRFETSEMTAEAYGNGQKVDNIILASGTNFPDALSGSVLTTALKAPMLLVGSDANNSKAYNYIKNYLADNGKVYILGGTGAVSQKVEDYVTKTLNKSVIRIGGKDRFETNKMIIDTLKPSKGTPVIIATADNFADSVSVSSVAAIKGYPIVLVRGKHLSECAQKVINNIQPSAVYVIGGTGAVDDNIIAEIKDKDTALTDANIIRIAGINRYETSLNVLKYFSMNQGNLIVATGADFADALSGTALAAKQFAPILLTSSTSLKDQLLTMAKYTNITVIGGYGALTEDVEKFLDGKPVLPA